MTASEVAEFLRQIYASQTREEYLALWDKIAFFNIGIDMSKLIWDVDATPEPTPEPTPAPTPEPAPLPTPLPTPEPTPLPTSEG